MIAGLMSTTHTSSQTPKKPIISEFASLPNTEGMAGMFAGISNGTLFCMGGANFPNLKPWQGGTKNWYEDIYMLNQGGSWQKIHQKAQF